MAPLCCAPSRPQAVATLPQIQRDETRGEVWGQSSALRIAVCAMVSAASLVVRVPEMADAATPYAQSQAERLQIGLLNG